MNKHRLIFGTAVLVLALGTSPSQFAQEPSSSQQTRDHALTVGFLRTVNTAEAGEFSTRGSYASWRTLLAHQQEYLHSWLTHRSPQPNAQFGELPQILPGLNLRLNIHPDGRGYDILVEDTNDQSGYAALSDERAIIRECHWLQ